MTTPTTPDEGSTNRLLARLPQDVYQQLRPSLQAVPLKIEQVLHEFRGPVHYVYFPTAGTTSLLTVMRSGAAIEVGTVGREGMVGLTAVLGVPVAPNRVIVQVAGGALRIEAAALTAAARADGPLRETLLRYQTAFLMQVSQSVACNGLHPVEQRCCRWLLDTRDRLESDVLPLTHEFLGMMLGVRRASVTGVLQALQDGGLIRYQRGKITVADRARLESAVCECYRSVRDEFDRLLG